MSPGSDEQRARERQALDRAESIARERTDPEQHQHLAEARRRIEEREGRVGRELGRALENHLKNGPHKAGAGSVGRLINTANTLFRDRQNGIDLAQRLIAYGRELEATWKGFGGSYTDPDPTPVRQREPPDDWMQRAQREMAERQQAMAERDRQFIREQLRLSAEVHRTREAREPATERSRESRAREIGPRERERGRGGRGD